MTEAAIVGADSAGKGVGVRGVRDRGADELVAVVGVGSSFVISFERWDEMREG